MKNIKRHINEVEAMLAVSEKSKNIAGIGRFSPFEIESIRAIVDVAKGLNDLLDFMDRLIPTEEED